jgi:hypothetical protein
MGLSDRIRFQSAAAPVVTGLTDSLGTAPAFARSVIGDPSDSWSYRILGGNTPIANPPALPTFNMGAALAGGGGNGLGLGALYFGANPPYTIAAGIVPLVCDVGSAYYNAQKKFIQITFNDAAGMAPVIGWCNFIDLSGSGVAGNDQINHDAYAFRIDNRGLLTRYNSGGPNGGTVIHAVGGAPVQGDVHRLSIDQTVAGQVTLIYTLNGVVQYTVVDNAANRVANQLFPLIGNLQFAGAGPSGGCKNWSCGLGL